MGEEEFIELLKDNGFTVKDENFDFIRLTYEYPDGSVLAVLSPSGDDTYYNVNMTLWNDWDDVGSYREFIARVTFDKHGPMGANGRSNFSCKKDVEDARYQLAKYMELI